MLVKMGGNRVFAAELFRFGIVGAVLWAMDVGIYLSLVELGFPILAANTVSVFLTSVLAFVTHLRFTFVMRGSATIGRTLGKFALVTTILALLNLAVSSVLIESLSSSGSEVAAIKAGTVILVAAVRFIVLRGYVYK